MQRVNVDDISRDAMEYVVYDGQRFTGEAVETGYDGTVIGMNTYADGVENGPQREWWADGSLRSEYSMVKGQVIGEAREWHENGRLAKLQVWGNHGELVSQEQWDENGEPDVP